MAIVKEIETPIKNHSYVYNSIEYILSPENRNGDEKCYQATCLNCENNGAYGLATQFYVTRAAFNQDNKILAHHYVQSFSKNDNITSDQAHQLGVELAKKVAPNYQVIVATHIDKDHIHNHIIINAPNLKTGLKWRGDKKTRLNMRRESDKLCVREGLQVVDDKSGLKGLDQATRECAKKGGSWKIKLCHDLEAAIKACKSKAEFIEFMEARNYDVDYRSDRRHIVFRNKQFDKKVRADTLAKQFGSMFSKDSLEKAMGYYKPPAEAAAPIESKTQPNPLQYESEWERFSERTFDDEVKEFTVVPKEKSQNYYLINNSPHPFLELMKRIFLSYKKRRCDKKYRLLKNQICEATGKVQITHQYAMKRWKETSLEERLKVVTKTVGNISYKALTSAQGANFRVKVSPANVAELFNCPFFFSAKVSSDSAIVTVKEKDKMLLATALGLNGSELIDSHNEQLTNKMNYARIKEEAKRRGVKPEYLVIDRDKLKILKEKFIDLAYFEKENGKISIAFLPSSKKRIFDLLFDKKKIKKHDEELARNTEINKELKAIEALGRDVRRFKVIDETELPLLHKLPNNIKFAYFRKKNGKINIVYLKSQQSEIEQALKAQKEKKNDVKQKR